ncbi:aldo/keto reductase [Micromonospora sp. M12]
MAVAWLLSRPAVTSVIVGARKQEQLVDNIAASDLTLTAEDLTALDEVTKLPVAYPNWIQEGFFAGLRLPQ